MSTDKTFMSINEGQLISDIVRHDHEIIAQLITACRNILTRVEALETAYMEDKLLGKDEAPKCP